ncbi:MAG: glucose-6-phosphate isomerase [Bacteroidales bacterium]|nr:glucose-6-phosphate isomerase [Bacteroidales bacterium]
MKKLIKPDFSMASPWISEETLASWEKPAGEAMQLLHNQTGLGNDFLGWINLPEEALQQLPLWKEAALQFAGPLDTIVVVGIGGSYLGARAVIEALPGSLPMHTGHPQILFAGHHLSGSYLQTLVDKLSHHNWGLVVISKSGTTTEPAIAFRVLKDQMENQFGRSQLKHRIIAITDAHKGALRKQAGRTGYQTFIIPDNVGGRYSVFTPVGIIPILMAGIDAGSLLQGALYAAQHSTPETPFTENPPALYAAARNLLLQKGKLIEVLANFDPSLHYFGEWWKQLFGESEGKDGKGIFPAGVDLTTDLHSMGQYIQQGPRHLFETVVRFDAPSNGILIHDEPGDTDQLNYLAGRHLDEVNEVAAQATMMAHHEGGVPVISLSAGPGDAFHLGQLLYFFEKSCGISGYLLGVNPFNQPGVEAYKNNMFRLLGKPGYHKP